MDSVVVKVQRAFVKLDRACQFLELFETVRCHVSSSFAISLESLILVLIFRFEFLESRVVFV